MNIQTVTTTTIKLSNTILKNKNLKGKFKGMSARNLKARSYVSLSRKPKSCWWPLRPACWPLSPSLISPLSPLPLLTPQFHKTLLSQHARCSYSTGFGSSGLSPGMLFWQIPLTPFQMTCVQCHLFSENPLMKPVSYLYPLILPPTPHSALKFLFP